MEKSVRKITLRNPLCDMLLNFAHAMQNKEELFPREIKPLSHDQLQHIAQNRFVS